MPVQRVAELPELLADLLRGQRPCRRTLQDGAAGIGEAASERCGLVRERREGRDGRVDLGDPSVERRPLLDQGPVVAPQLGQRRVVRGGGHVPE